MKHVFLNCDMSIRFGLDEMISSVCVSFQMGQVVLKVP